MKNKKSWKVVVYNDDYHTYEEVVSAFTGVLKIDEENAMMLAEVISSTGRAVVWVCYDEEQAQDIAQQLREITSMENSVRATAGIQVEVDSDS